MRATGRGLSGEPADREPAEDCGCGLGVLFLFRVPVCGVPVPEAGVPRVLLEVPGVRVDEDAGVRPQLLALRLESNFFIAFPLLIVVVVVRHQKYEPLATILKSVLRNKVMIMGSWLLLLITLYIFSAAGFFMFSRSYFFADPGENACQSMVACFLSTASLGLRSAGGVADQLQRVSYSQKDVYFMRLVFDELAFVLVNVLGMNILFGVLLDSLSEQRIKNQAIGHALAQRCFICGIEKAWVRFPDAARPEAQRLRGSHLRRAQHLELLQVHLLRPQEAPVCSHRRRQVGL